MHVGDFCRVSALSFNRFFRFQNTVGPFFVTLPFRSSWHSCWTDDVYLCVCVHDASVCRRRPLCFFTAGKGIGECVRRVSMRVSGWRRKPWSLHRWGWCKGGSAGSAVGNKARWSSGGTGPNLPAPGQHQQHEVNTQRKNSVLFLLIRTYHNQVTSTLHILHLCKSNSN